MQLNELLGKRVRTMRHEEGRRRQRTCSPCAATSPFHRRPLDASKSYRELLYEHASLHSPNKCTTRAYLQAQARRPAKVSPRAAQSLAVMSRCVESIEWMKFGANAVLCLRLFTGR